MHAQADLCVHCQSLTEGQTAGHKAMRPLPQARHQTGVRGSTREACALKPQTLNPETLTFWMLATLCTPEMSAAARPKKVLAPVAYTSAWRSPCLTDEPEKATSPGAFQTGSDSPVSAAWSTCAGPAQTNPKTRP